MRAFLGAAWLVAFTLPVQATAQTKEFHDTVPLASGGSLTVEGSKGDIELTGWDRDEVEIRARIVAPDGVDRDYARRAVEATEVAVSASGDTVTVRSDYDDVPRRDVRGRSVPHVHYEIRAPRRLALSVSSDRGDMTLADFEGDIRLDVDRGEMSLRDVGGDLRIHLDRGGSSSIDSLRGSFDLDADRSRVRMEDVRIEGDSRIAVDRTDVDIEVEGGQGLDVKADLTRRADFDTDLPMLLRSQKGRDFEGSINGGGPRLSIESDRGSVRLRSSR